MKGGKGKLLLLVMAALILASAAFLAGRLSKPAFSPGLAIVGDVGQCLDITALAGLGQLESVTWEGTRYQGLRLDKVVAAAQPRGEVSQVLLSASDGFSVALAGDSLDACWLTFAANSGWRLIAPSHPLSANATLLQRLVVVADNAENGITVTAPGGVWAVGPGQLYAGAVLSYPYPEGGAEKESDGRLFTSTVYTRRDCLGLVQLGLAAGQAVTITAADGQSLTLAAGAAPLFQLGGNRLDYIDPAGRQGLTDIRAISVE